MINPFPKKRVVYMMIEDGKVPSGSVEPIHSVILTASDTIYRLSKAKHFEGPGGPEDKMHMETGERPGD